ncbi:peroxiredoxin [uncultured Psychroserpens sp.]|uniref:peroxiredoxin family protein n=1 Tax=uncultured Psychroserpens sp. TaxID=255436 RepID=UPI002618D0B2|nr:TlpA disulfide reductase family protein [uncultured Psychroserpens sp.]
MKKHHAILTLILCFTLHLSFGQNEANKTYTKEEMAEFQANYKAKKKKEKAARKGLEGTTLTELSFEDIDGNKHTYESLKGKVVVMNFWFIHCKPCVAEIPDLNKLKAEFKNKDVTFFAVALDSKASLDKFLEKTTFDFTIIPNGRVLARDLKIPHYPYNVILDKKGKLQYVSDVLSFNIMNRLKRKINGVLKR